MALASLSFLGSSLLSSSNRSSSSSSPFRLRSSVSSSKHQRYCFRLRQSCDAVITSSPRRYRRRKTRADASVEAQSIDVWPPPAAGSVSSDVSPLPFPCCHQRALRKLRGGKTTASSSCRRRGRPVQFVPRRSSRLSCREIDAREYPKNAGSDAKGEKAGEAQCPDHRKKSEYSETETENEQQSAERVDDDKCTNGRGQPRQCWLPVAQRSPQKSFFKKSISRLVSRNSTPQSFIRSSPKDRKTSSNIYNSLSLNAVSQNNSEFHLPRGSSTSEKSICHDSGDEFNEASGFVLSAEDCSTSNDCTPQNNNIADCQLCGISAASPLQPTWGGSIKEMVAVDPSASLDLDKVQWNGGQSPYPPDKSQAENDLDFAETSSGILYSSLLVPSYELSLDREFTWQLSWGASCKRALAKENQDGWFLCKAKQAFMSTEGLQDVYGSGFSGIRESGSVVVQDSTEHTDAAGSLLPTALPSKCVWGVWLSEAAKAEVAEQRRTVCLSHVSSTYVENTTCNGVHTSNITGGSLSAPLSRVLDPIDKLVHRTYMSPLPSPSRSVQSVIRIHEQGRGSVSSISPWFFGVMDGHGSGGRAASHTACKVMSDVLKKTLQLSATKATMVDDSNCKIVSSADQFLREEIGRHDETETTATPVNRSRKPEHDFLFSKSAIQQATWIVHNLVACKMAEGFARAHDEVKGIQTDSDELGKACDFGTTAVIVALLGRYLITSNCGDSTALCIIPDEDLEEETPKEVSNKVCPTRCVPTDDLASPYASISGSTLNKCSVRKGVRAKIIYMSNAHSVHRIEERERIEQSGTGRIVVGDLGVQRVIPAEMSYPQAKRSGLSINMTRSIGHRILSECAVIPHPEYSIIDLHALILKCQFLSAYPCDPSEVKKEIERCVFPENGGISPNTSRQDIDVSTPYRSWLHRPLLSLQPALHSPVKAMIHNFQRLKLVAHSSLDARLVSTKPFDSPRALTIASTNLPSLSSSFASVVSMSLPRADEALPVCEIPKYFDNQTVESTKLLGDDKANKIANLKRAKLARTHSTIESSTPSSGTLSIRRRSERILPKSGSCQSPCGSQVHTLVQLAENNTSTMKDDSFLFSWDSPRRETVYSPLSGDETHRLPDKSPLSKYTCNISAIIFGDL